MRTPSRLVPVVVWTSLAVLPSACETPTDASAPRSRTTATAAPRTSAPATAPVRGDAAVWILEPDQNLRGSATTFTALVSRLGCNGGVTGQVLPPEIRITESAIVVTFAVAPEQRGAAACPGNEQVPYVVDLHEPLRDRSLEDGRCLPGGEAATTSFCSPDGTRLPPGGRPGTGR